MNINNLVADFGPDIYYDPRFRNTLEDNMTLFRNDANTGSVSIEAYQEIKYEGDFFGLLSALSQPKQYHWLIMRINYLNNPSDYRPGMFPNGIMLPDRTRVERMKSLYITQNKIKS